MPPTARTKPTRAAALAGPGLPARAANTCAGIGLTGSINAISGDALRQHRSNGISGRRVLSCVAEFTLR